MESINHGRDYSIVKVHGQAAQQKGGRASPLSRQKTKTAKPGYLTIWLTDPKRPQ